MSRPAAMRAKKTPPKKPKPKPKLYRITWYDSPARSMLEQMQARRSHSLATLGRVLRGG